MKNGHINRNVEKSLSITLFIASPSMKPTQNTLEVKSSRSKGLGGTYSRVVRGHLGINDEISRIIY